MASRPPGREPSAGGRDVFRSQLQIQDSREKHQDKGTESDDSESLSSQSSIFHQGKVPINWLVSDSSSAHDRASERASGGKDSQNTSSSSRTSQLDGQEQSAGKGPQAPGALPSSAGPRGSSAASSGLQTDVTKDFAEKLNAVIKSGYSSSSWFATTFEDSEIAEDRGAGSSSDARGVEKFGYIHPSLQSADTQAKDMDVSQDVEQRCMDILMSIPKDEEGRLTSLGSLSHKSGDCKPCAYWFKRACKHGVACYNCHITHEGQKPKRLRSSKAKINKEISDSSIPEEGELRQKDWKKNMNERAIPSAPGPVGEETVDLKVTAALLKQMSSALGFKVTEPPRSSFPVDAPKTKTSL